MHIVYFTNEFTIDSFHCGGLANYTSNMANIFAEKGHKITVVIVNRNPQKRKGFQWKENIRIEYLSLMDLDGYFLYDSKKKGIWDYYYNVQGMINNIITECKLLSINRKEKIDIVQFSNELLYAARSYCFPSLVRITALKFHFRLAYLPVFDFEKAKDKINSYESQQLDSISRAFEVIDPGRLIGGIAQELTGKRVYCIESPFYSHEDTWDFQIYDEQLKDKKYILFFGSLGYLKGVYTIGEMIYRILDKYRDIHMVFAGKIRNIDGAEDKSRKIVRMLTDNAMEHAKRVIYLGEIEKKYMYPIIKNAEFCLLPSRIDNLPNTCIESMGLGKIVIGTKKASFEQLIRDNYNGFLGERDNAQSYLDAIDKVMSLNEDEKNLISKRAVARIRKMNPEIIYDRHLLFYQYVIRKFKSH